MKLFKYNAELVNFISAMETYRKSIGDDTEEAIEIDQMLLNYRPMISLMDNPTEEL